MKYLKRYNEKNSVELNSELKSNVENLIVDLKDDFEVKVTENDYNSKKDTIKVTVSKNKEFKYEDIKSYIEDVWYYLNKEGFEIEWFTSSEYEKHEEPEDEFSITQMVKGYHWTTDLETGAIKSIEKEYQRRPDISNSSTSTVGNWKFEISFIKVIKDPLTNEDWDPQTYLNTAKELKRLGHVNRPKKLEEWGLELQRREKEAEEERKRKEKEAGYKKALDEAKKLGQFQLKFEYYNANSKVANCYIQLYFNSDYYKTELMPEWLNGNSTTIHPQIMFGIHPVTEEDLEVINWYIGGDVENYTNQRNGVIWLQDIYFCLTNTSYKSEDGEELPMTPTNNISIEGSEFKEVYFSNRREAIKFRNILVSLFEGDIDYIQVNGKDFKDEINETLCEHEERPVKLSELEDLIDKFRLARLNLLYRD